MASAAGKHEWIVVMPDNAGVLETRMEVRPLVIALPAILHSKADVIPSDHLKGVTPKVEEGFWKFGGAFLDEPIKEGETPKIRGSVMLALASSKEEVVEQLKNDIYTKKGVWNWDKVQIYPFRSVFRKEL
ncbi:MAG: hypothetical protein M4579_007545 [Chaenotheca gracillima]|nr:MAG: hypothetical protein M4579_007545 [Chaenotheca gracillima]